MVSFITSIKQFGQQGEKTGWTYIDIPPDIAEKLKPGSRKSFRVKGKLDAHPVSQVALLPMGDGGFIIPLNADLRKALHKKKGALLKVSFREDKKAILVSADLLLSFDDAPAAKKKFTELPPSHQIYFSKWIESAKTVQTKARRIAMTVMAMEKNMTYAEMLRANQTNPQSVNK